ncbi:hypothetical protein NQZ68_041624 [Dissostichus eleginoides]|nr:hypothetical protein NQZ68_041624 [Dissostichus eleginoides]
MSKGEILREIVTERLSAASREILAAVDRIIAEYEDEVSGFRQQISRQEIQLELLQDHTEGAVVVGFLGRVSRTPPHIESWTRTLPSRCLTLPTEGEEGDAVTAFVYYCI